MTIRVLMKQLYPPHGMELSEYGILEQAKQLELLEKGFLITLLETQNLVLAAKKLLQREDFFF